MESNPYTTGDRVSLILSTGPGKRVWHMGTGTVTDVDGDLTSVCWDNATRSTHHYAHLSHTSDKEPAVWGIACPARYNNRGVYIPRHWLADDAETRDPDRDYDWTTSPESKSVRRFVNPFEASLMMVNLGIEDAEVDRLS